MRVGALELTSLGGAAALVAARELAGQYYEWGLGYNVAINWTGDELEPG